jgi:hypothetical protein
MIGAGGTHVAAPLRVFITNEGTHSPEHWAIVTARMLVSEGANISPDRIDACTALRAKMVATLTEAFRATRPTSSLVEIAGNAQSVVRRLVDHAKGGPWEMEFGHEDIVAMMEDVVHRNLLSHADIGLRTE